jgi:hypothetical protein
MPGGCPVFAGTAADSLTMTSERGASVSLVCVHRGYELGALGS